MIGTQYALRETDTGGRIFLVSTPRPEYFRRSGVIIIINPVEGDIRSFATIPSFIHDSLIAPVIKHLGKSSKWSRRYLLTNGKRYSTISVLDRTVPTQLHDLVVLAMSQVSSGWQPLEYSTDPIAEEEYRTHTEIFHINAQSSRLVF